MFKLHRELKDLHERLTRIEDRLNRQAASELVEKYILGDKPRARFYVVRTNHTPPQFNVYDRVAMSVVAFFGSRHFNAKANAEQYAMFRNSLED